MQKKPWAAVAAAVPLAAGCLYGSAAAALPARAHAAEPPRVPAGTTAAWVVFDRRAGAAGKIVAMRNAHRKFRSASVVKILIAIDYLERRGTVPAGDARLLQEMLRSSDDAAATTLWTRSGRGAIVTRTARRLGLADTTPPPASHPGFWGYTSLSAYDIVRTYRYLLDTAEPRVRETILGHLRRATPCGNDGFHQYFGIPSGVPRPWAVKQGWSGFGAVPPTRCAASAAGGTAAGGTTGGSVSAVARRAAGSGVPDYGRPVLHSTGLAGKGERYVMAVLTAHPAGGTWNDSVRRVNRLTADLYRGLS
ncbi:MAG: hypothetical protein K0R62_5719 [Nonomuraea muscovyensis]|uniref:Serine hydrolase n=1 Tax=Nonomuraea muscovyensis TaxID=1124761 RepID=A0A7X0EZK7_9ACTN|nr:hypothetical protein [Nonomuraea muscovyensis]MBB6346820.1 hypothetical protein [Nonomuraea muscovyensis]MDF2710067.1 hypothetical protein [Nonomuraea muscovyensis]